jgi:hypothetical protein
LSASTLALGNKTVKTLPLCQQRIIWMKVKRDRKSSQFTISRTENPTTTAGVWEKETSKLIRFFHSREPDPCKETTLQSAFLVDSNKTSSKIKSTVWSVHSGSEVLLATASTRPHWIWKAKQNKSVWNKWI